jgi:hypothetical protein
MHHSPFHHRQEFFGIAALMFVVIVQACAAVAERKNSDGGAGGGSNGSTGDGGDLDLPMGASSGAASMPPCTPKGPDDDVDGDGFTPNGGDCNDCDKNVNNNAIEVITKSGQEPHDENCDDVIDETTSQLCDENLQIDSNDPFDGARAVDLCKLSTGTNDWGVVSAKWVMADGKPPPDSNLDNFHLGHGILPHFGPNIAPLHGARMLAVSTGTARQPGDPGYRSVSGFTKGYQCNHPPGFPKESPSCPGKITGEPNDATGLEVAVRVPSNAHGFSFRFNFYTYEWPNYMCSQFNDFFVALLSPIPVGQTDGNVSFDIQGNPVSVNNAFLDVCGCQGNPPASCMAGNKAFKCALGDTDLNGTGFGIDSEGMDHAATGWLETQAPATPGNTITLRWVVYDSGDGNFDSSTLIDNWQWIAEPGVSVGTDPIPK